MSPSYKDFVTPLVYEGVDGLTITHCNFYGMDGKVAITLKNCKNVLISENDFDGCGGIYAVGCSLITVTKCDALNIQAPFPRGQFFQGNDCKGPITISKNIIRCNNPEKNDTEDIINFFKCVGTETTPLLVSGNYISNLGASSKTGGGIMLGNGAPSAWQYAFDNVLVNPGQYGIAISGGNHMKIAGNQIYSDKTAISNVGMYVWAQNPRGETGTPPPISDVEIQYNKVNWTNKVGVKNAWWQGSPVMNLKMTGNDFKWLLKPTVPIIIPEDDEKDDPIPVPPPTPKLVDPKVDFERDLSGKVVKIIVSIQ